MSNTSSAATINEIKLDVPIKSYLKKYLSHFYETDPFRMSRHGLIAEHMWLLFAQDYTEYDGTHEKFKDYLTVVVPHLFFRQNRIHFDLATIRRLNVVIEDLMWQEAMTFLDARMGLMETKEAINEFQARYDFDEGELAFDTIKKRYYRHRKRLKNGKKHTQES